MKKIKQIYEGKAKKVFSTEDPDFVIVEYKDDATAFNGEKKGVISGKGVINNRVSNFFFQKRGKAQTFVNIGAKRCKVEICLLSNYTNIAAGSSKALRGGETVLLTPTRVPKKTTRWGPAHKRLPCDSAWTSTQRKLKNNKHVISRKQVLSEYL